MIQTFDNIFLYYINMYVINTKISSILFKSTINCFFFHFLNILLFEKVYELEKIKKIYQDYLRFIFGAF